MNYRLIPVSLALERQRQKGHCKFEASLIYIKF